MPQAVQAVTAPRGSALLLAQSHQHKMLLLLIVSECLFVPPGLSLQNHWTAQGIEVLMYSLRIKFQDLINTH